MIGDQELSVMRQKYYSLFVSLFWREPAPELIVSLKEGIDERIEASQNILMAEGWRKVRHYLQEKKPDSVRDEFTTLFLGPAEPENIPYESYYLTGHLFREPLAAVRGFMKKVGLRKKEDPFNESEDILGFEMEIMNWLVTKQSTAANTEEEEQWLNLQSEFLKMHLLVWAPTCLTELEKAKHSDFYGGISLLLRGFFEIENQLFEDREPKQIPTLGQIRRQYGVAESWTGPTFNPEIENQDLKSE
ncbi:MAG: molecular chaperone TorD family protein [Proteobacteria bacterium]|nr:molecular chaperone TorD family protein [Pseudomonadota bacterium]